MGYYKDGKYVYTFLDVGGGKCDENTYLKQEQVKAKKARQENTGMDTTVVEDKDE